MPCTIGNRGEEGLETRAYAITESVTRSHDCYGSMVSGLVRAAISFYNRDSTFSGCSEGSKQAKGQAKHLIGQISEEEN